MLQKVVKVAKGADCKSRGDCGQETGGKKVENLKERRGVNRGPCQEGPSAEHAELKELTLK